VLAVILPAATACNFIACCATALAAALCIVPWHFCHVKGCHGIALQAMALFFVLWHCMSCHGFVLHTAALCFVPQRFASCHSIMLHGVALCIMLGILFHATDMMLPTHPDSPICTNLLTEGGYPHLCIQQQCVAQHIQHNTP